MLSSFSVESSGRCSITIQIKHVRIIIEKDKVVAVGVVVVVVVAAAAVVVYCVVDAILVLSRIFWEMSNKNPNKTCKNHN